MSNDIKVHLIRMNDYPDDDFLKVYNLLTTFQGPVKYFVSGLEISLSEDNDDPYVIEREWKKKELERKQEYPTLFAECKSINISKYFEEVPEFEIRKPWKWDALLNECSKARAKLRASKNDFVCLLTSRPNERNWFMAGDFKNEGRDFFVHTGDWDYFVTSSHHYPVTYEIVTHLLRSYTYKTEAETKMKIHLKTIGCYNDFCKEKKDVAMKLRTADICLNCTKDIRSSGIAAPFVSQVVNTMEGIRKQMLFVTGFNDPDKPSVLRVTRDNRIFLPDYGNIEFNFTALEKTVYLFFLKSVDGVPLTNIDHHREELRQLYRSVSNLSDLKKIESNVNRLVDYTDNSMNEKISKIKAKIKDAVGEELSGHYIISGKPSQPRKIMLPRELIVFEQSV